MQGNRYIHKATYGVSKNMYAYLLCYRKEYIDINACANT